MLSVTSTSRFAQRCTIPYCPIDWKGVSLSPLSWYLKWNIWRPLSAIEGEGNEWHEMGSKFLSYSETEEMLVNQPHPLLHIPCQLYPCDCRCSLELPRSCQNRQRLNTEEDTWGNKVVSCLRRLRWRKISQKCRAVFFQSKMMIDKHAAYRCI